MNESQRATKKLLKKIAKKSSKVAALYKELEEVRRDLDCDHPEKYVKDYTWEWDSGYGVQKKITGCYCVLCRKKNPHKSPFGWIQP